MGRPRDAARAGSGAPRAHPEEPALPADVDRAGRLAGVHGDGEAVRARHRPRLRPHRPRHAADAHALDFLDAPDRILDFLGNDAARASSRPRSARASSGSASPSSAAATSRRRSRASPGRPRSPTSATSSRASRACTRGSRIARPRCTLLSQPDVGFVLVTSPSPLSIDEALAFHERLHAESMPIAGVVANRVTPISAGRRAAARDRRRRERARRGGRAGRRARRAARRHARGAPGALGRVERALERLFAEIDAPHAVVPRLESDVHDLRGSPCSRSGCSFEAAVLLPPLHVATRRDRPRRDHHARPSALRASGVESGILVAYVPTPPPASPSRRTPIPTCEGTSCSRSRTRCRRGRPPARTATRRGTATRT